MAGAGLTVGGAPPPIRRDMNNQKHAGANWIKSEILGKQADQISDLGTKAADLLGFVFQGIYHVERSALKRAGWMNPRWVYVNVPRLTRLEMTRFLLGACQLGLYVEIFPRNFQYVQLRMFRQEEQMVDLIDPSDALEYFSRVNYFPSWKEQTAAAGDAAPVR